MRTTTTKTSKPRTKARAKARKPTVTCTALVKYNPHALAVRTSTALATRPAPTPRRKPLDDFLAWVTPRFKAQFEEPTSDLIAETRRFYRSDRYFRAAVKAGENGKARRELWDLLGVLS